MEGEVKQKQVGLGINAKLAGLLLPTVIVVLSLIVLLVYRNTARIVQQTSQENLQTNTESIVNSVTAWMNKVLTALDTERDALEYFALDPAAELAYIKHTANQYDAFPSGIYIGTTEGELIHASFVPGPDYDVLKKPWYLEGLSDTKFAFESVYLDENSKSYIVGASCVIKNPDGSVRGVASADIYLDAISEIVSQVTLEQTGGVFLVDGRTGFIIGHRDSSLLGTELSAQQDPMYQYAAQQIAAKADGLQTFEAADGEFYLDFTPVPNSDWTAVAYVPVREVMSELNTLTMRIVAIAVAAVIILLTLILILLRRTVIRPVREIDRVAQRIAEGKLDEEIGFRSRDEFGVLAESFNKTVARLRNYIDYIDEISSVLNQIADGNLLYELTYDYSGEFSKVKDALERISSSLNQTLGGIRQSAGQVASGSEQVSAGAQALSQGATEQASAVEELAATINEVSARVQNNAASAQQAKEKAALVGREMGESDQQMKELVAAMERISNSSSEIGKIIKTIEDIAFQTNILALNAAVEAARAGTAGKGFAVVADEVRNLANKSQEASKNTSALIEGSIQAVEEGTRIADETAASLRKAVEDAETVVQAVDQISNASAEQAGALEQVSQGVDQISAVVQTNSATAEQSAAASQQLSSQAQFMRGLAEKFRLRAGQEEQDGQPEIAYPAQSAFDALGAGKY